MKNEDREFRLRPWKPASNSRRESAAWSVAFKAVLRQARMSRTQKPGVRVRGSSQCRKSFHQRCAVRITYSRNAIKGQWRAHGWYIARDSATRPDQMGLGAFSDKSDAVDMTAILEGWQRSGDERMWKLIVSPEFGERADFQKLTRELLRNSAEKARVGAAVKMRVEDYFDRGAKDGCGFTRRAASRLSCHVITALMKCWRNTLPKLALPLIRKDGCSGRPPQRTEPPLPTPPCASRTTTP